LDAKKKHNFILDYNFYMLAFKEDWLVEIMTYQ
jgi:hypothetical protein